MLAQQKPSLYQLSEIKDGPRISNVERDDELNDYYIDDDGYFCMRTNKVYTYTGPK